MTKEGEQEALRKMFADFPEDLWVDYWDDIDADDGEDNVRDTGIRLGLAWHILIVVMGLAIIMACVVLRVY